MKKAELKTIKVLDSTISNLNKYAAAYNVTQYTAAEMASLLALNQKELSLKSYNEQVRLRSDELQYYVSTGFAPNPEWGNETFHKWLKAKNKALSAYKKATELALVAAAIK